MTIETPTVAATMLEQLAGSRKLGEEHRRNRGFLINFFWAFDGPVSPAWERGTTTLTKGRFDIAQRLAKGEYDADTLHGWARMMRGEV